MARFGLRNSALYVPSFVLLIIDPNLVVGAEETTQHNFSCGINKINHVIVKLRLRRCTEEQGWNVRQESSEVFEFWQRSTFCLVRVL